MKLKVLTRILISVVTCLILLVAIPKPSYTQVPSLDDARRILDGFTSEINQTTKRSCKAYYELSFNSVNGQPASTVTQLGDFEARRGCGTLVPNRCRRRARDTAVACLTSGWNNRQALTQRIPAECVSAGNQIGMLNYNVINFEETAAAEACRYAGRGSTINLNVNAVTRGDTGCGPGDAKSQKIPLANSYNFTCR